MADQPEVMPPWERPARVPDRVPIAQANPSHATWGEAGTWELPFTLTEEVPPGAGLLLQVHSHRNNKGEFAGLQCEDPEGDAYLSVRVDDGSELAVRATDRAGIFEVSVPGKGLPEGSQLTACLGHGAEAPRFSIPNKFFVLMKGPGGDADGHAGTADGAILTHENWDRVIGACRMHVLGSGIDRIRVYAPSQCVPGEDVVLLVRPEDRRGNPASRRMGSLTVSLDGTALESTCTPVPESTCVRVCVQLPDEGVHRFVVHDSRSGREATSNPTRCTPDADGCEVLWGMIHGHTEMSDGTGTLERYFRQMRDEAGLDFGATADHDHLWETPEAFWHRTCRAVRQWDDAGRFVALLGYEWAKWRRNGDGDRNVYYRHDDRPMYRSDDGEYATPSELFRALEGETAIVIPHHPAHAGNFCDWKDHDPVCERLVEIYQMRGSYECSAEDGNPLPERGAQDPISEGYVRRALAMGWRVGFTGGGDDHRGHAGMEFPVGLEPDSYSDGLLCVEAEARTREAVWQALWNRRTVATSGPRVLLTYRVNGHPMGCELSARKHDHLREQRRLKIEFHGTAPAESIDIIRSNRVVRTIASPGLDCTVEWTDETSLDSDCLPAARFCPNPFCFYYIRVTQADGEVAWASPIWIDP